MPAPQTGLTLRLRDGNGRVQMAEGPWPSPDGACTPTESFFVVNHYDAPEPVALEEAVLEVAAPDGDTRTLSSEEILGLGATTETALLECAGMSRGYLQKRTPGIQWGHGLCGVAAWTGVSLARVLDAAGLGATGFSTLVVRGRDAGTAQPEDVHSDFAKGLPPAKALAASTLLAWEMNGAPLPHEHGGPFRLVVPGWYGVWWVKWASRIELSDEEFHGFWQAERYTYQDAGGARLAVVDEQLPRAMIVEPRDGAAVRRDRFRRVAGHAWAGEHAIAGVEISFDNGAEWLDATLAGRAGEHGWYDWELEVAVPPPPGILAISARATDDAGRTQGWSSRENRLGYGNNGIHVVEVDLVTEE